MIFSKIFQHVRIDIPVVLMILAVLLSAIVVVYAKHSGRSEFVALQKLENRRDQLEEEWGRLLLEQSTWATPGRVERQARNKLHMIVPTAQMTIVVKP
ncbi:MAG: cell division protein FtsL [Methylophaga sp.]|nr:MAG: cell division protein FtsL [Methylophaga sp.]